MNNAGMEPGSQMFGPHENWQRILSVDLWGVINGFSPAYASDCSAADAVLREDTKGIAPTIR
jgi:hypothetical protein